MLSEPKEYQLIHSGPKTLKLKISHFFYLSGKWVSFQCFWLSMLFVLKQLACIYAIDQVA